MRIFYKLVVLFLIFVSNQIVSIAQTSIDGIINSSIVLEKSKSPYLVTNNLVVFPSGKLTIEPGVELRFANDTKLEIRGELIAKGNKTDSKGIHLSKKLFATSPTFNIAAFSVLMITSFLYAIFW